MSVRRSPIAKTPILAVVSVLTVACSGTTSRPAVTPQPVADRAVVHIQNRWLVLHITKPAADPASAPFVLFVTGDGGWRGKDLDAFRHLAALGYPIAGFSAPDYLGHLRGDATSLPPRQLARDFLAVIGAASTALHLGPDPKALLVGVSRGGDLAVVAAAETPLRGSVVGVMAVGLTGEEEYVRHRHRHEMLSSTMEPTPPSETGEPGAMVKPYDYLARVDLPVCVIQSTNDEYVQAAEARRLFGPDRPNRRLLSIPARDHSFSDARATLYEEMRSSLDWLMSSSRSGAGGVGAQ